jgi:hypothetical protein
VIGLNQLSLSVAVKIMERGFSVFVVPSRKLSEQTINNYKSFVSDSVEETVKALESSNPIEFTILNEPFIFNNEMVSVKFADNGPESFRIGSIFEKGAHAVLVSPSDETKIVDICRILKQYQESNPQFATVRISAISNSTLTVQELEELQIQAFSRPSLVSEFMAKYLTQKPTGEDVSFNASELQAMIHPLEETPQLSFEGKFDFEEEDHLKTREKMSSRAMRVSRMLKARRNSIDVISSSSSPIRVKPHQKMASASDLNQLSGLSVLGLAETTLVDDDSHEKSPQIAYNIFSHEFSELRKEPNPSGISQPLLHSVQDE